MGGEVKKRKERTAETAQILWGEGEERACDSKKFWWVQRFDGRRFYGDPEASTGLFPSNDTAMLRRTRSSCSHYRYNWQFSMLILDWSTF
jgi:hypothetical protein